MKSFGMAGVVAYALVACTIPAAIAQAIEPNIGKLPAIGQQDQGHFGQVTVMIV
ncbi:hypothetical protein [Noviherbaspirillum galbum]|uniref:Uncharacterized protein n=1 Tax=Noviherbaspirillum galbum TaxID=2709383 RepID=A0A6B3SL39_9BURK|nr:hypothetical protein [Noviherbaspirillum galbum]NEX60085.1 hypothetical protein [Noviherbaspirillum galbum]